jgi:hypothetical protein
VIVINLHPRAKCILIRTAAKLTMSLCRHSPPRADLGCGKSDERRRVLGRRARQEAVEK